MVRVHYELDDELHRRVKVCAASEGMTLKRFLELALTAAVERSESATRKNTAR